MRRSASSRRPRSPELLRLQTSDARVLEAAADWWPILSPPPKLTVSEWADRERQLSAEASAEPGKWDTSRAEYQRGIMDAGSDATVETVVVMSSSQVGKTELINNAVGFHVDQDPAPVLVIEPTLELADAWSKDRLAPMLRDTPALNGKIAKAKAKASGNTKRHKSFPGGHITMAGANSPASLAMRPIRVVLADEIDRYPPSAGAEGDPVSLARKRTTTFWNRKIVLVSTPTIKGVSRIEKAWAESDMRRYWVPCPACGAMQTLRWAQVRWDKGDAQGAYYLCEAADCGAAWSDAQRWNAVRHGEWRAEKPEVKGTAGFHLNELYSPWVKLAETVKSFLEAQGDPERLKVWTNTAMGELWEEQGEEVDQHALFARAQSRGWDGTAPIGVLLVTCGIDVQGDRLEIERVGWGLGDESWSLEHHVIYGDLSTPAPWRELDEYLLTPTVRADGRELAVAAACIDSGGMYTDAVCQFARGKIRRRVWAIKGDDGPRPVWPKLASKNKKSGASIFIVGVDTAKDSVYGRLRLAEPGPGFCHVPATREPEWFDQLTSEIVVTRYSKGFPIRVWQLKPGARNEALDCRVYAFAALRSMAISWGKVARILAGQEARSAATGKQETTPSGAGSSSHGAAPPAAEPRAQEAEPPAAKPSAPKKPQPRPTRIVRSTFLRR